jgi:hypothetical protein
VRLGWEHHGDRVAGAHLAAGHHDAHHARLADELSARAAVEDRGHQARAQAVELPAGVAQPGDLDHGLPAQPQPGAAGKAEQVDPSRGHVLPHLARCEGERRQLVVELRVDEMDLAEVGLPRVGADTGAVLHGGARVGVAFDPEPVDEPDRIPVELGDVVLRPTAHGHHDRRHRSFSTRAAACSSRRRKAGERRASAVIAR